MDELIELVVVERAEQLPGTPASVGGDGPEPDQRGVIQQHVDRLALEFERQGFDLHGVGDVHALNAHLGRILLLEYRQLVRSGVAPVCCNDRPALGGILLGELQTDALVRAGDEHRLRPCPRGHERGH